MNLQPVLRPMLSLHHLSPLYFLTPLSILPLINLLVFNPSSRTHHYLQDGQLFLRSSTAFTSVSHIMSLKGSEKHSIIYIYIYIFIYISHVQLSCSGIFYRDEATLPYALEKRPSLGQARSGLFSHLLVMVCFFTFFLPFCAKSRKKSPAYLTHLSWLSVSLCTTHLRAAAH